MMTTIAAMKLFTQPYIMTNGGPKESTMTLTYYLYRQGFQYRNMDMLLQFQLFSLL